MTPDKLERIAIEQFKKAVNAGDHETVRQVLQNHASLTTCIDEPWFAFNTPALVNAAYRGNREMVDVLLQFGADIHAKSSWWAGGFSVLHHDHHDLSRYLIERGAYVDPYAAASLGMLDELRRMVAEHPEVVNQRGPDGQVPLHAANSPEVIHYLLEHGADLEMRDVDHNSTPAQYAVNNPDKCKYLISLGAQTDIFMACMLGDIELVRHMLNESPQFLHEQVGQGNFTGPGGHIYEYHIGVGVKPIFLAERLGHPAMTDLMLSYSSMEQKFLLACLRTNRSTVYQLLSEHADIVQRLQPEDQNVMTDAAAAHNIEAVRLMLEVGFDVDVCHNARAMSALHRAAEHGDDEMVRLLLEHGASIQQLNAFGGTPLNSCIWGSQHNQDPLGDYALVAETLIQAGVKLPDPGRT